MQGNFTKDKKTLIEVMKQIPNFYFESYEKLEEILDILFSIFGEKIGGELDEISFIYLFDEKCKSPDKSLFTGYKKIKIIEIIRNKFSKFDKKEGMIKDLIEIIKNNLEDDFNEWKENLIKDKMYVEYDENQNYYFNDITNLTNGIFKKDAIKFITDNIKFCVSESKYYVRNIKSSNKSNISGLIERDRYIVWESIKYDDLIKTLKQYHLFHVKKLKTSETVKVSFDNLLYEHDIKKSISFGEAIFNPNYDNANFPFTFNIAPNFGAKKMEIENPSENVKIILDFIKNVLANKDKKYYDYLIGWFAHICQNPKIKTQTPIIFKCRESMYLEPFINIIGFGIFGESLYAKIDSKSKVKVNVNNKIFTLTNKILNNTHLMELNDEYNNIISISNNVNSLISIDDPNKIAIFEISEENYRENKERYKLMQNITQQDCDELYSYLLKINIGFETNFQIGEPILSEILLEKLVDQIDNVGKFYLKLFDGKITINSEFIKCSNESPGKRDIHFHTGAVYLCYVDYMTAEESEDDIITGREFGKKTLEYFGRPINQTEISDKRRIGYNLSYGSAIGKLKEKIGDVLISYIRMEKTDSEPIETEQQKKARNHTKYLKSLGKAGMFGEIYGIFNDFDDFDNKKDILKELETEEGLQKWNVKAREEALRISKPYYL